MFYQKSAENIIKEFNTDPAKGITSEEAGKRFSQYGPNALPVKEKPHVIFKLITQFKQFLVIILIFAAAISLFLGDTLDALAIIAIVLLNATIGFIQEISAEKTLESLRKKETHETLVIRGGSIEKVTIENIVPGDILVLEEGSKVPADARIFESFSLHIDESILTGESLPSGKNAQIISKQVPLADWKNMIFKDTQIVSGRGKAVVIATGRNTEIGKIALFLETSQSEKTPLTAELEKVARALTYIVIMIAFFVFSVNVFRQNPLVESLLVSISLAVAAIPEGLPAIVTIVLSLGVKRLAEKKTIVKQLPSVETLGAVKIIATDKTGTLTQNKINAVKIILPNGKTFSIVGRGYDPKGVYFDEKNKITDPQKQKDLVILLRAMSLANNAQISVKRSDLLTVIGDTTEVALLVAAARANLDIDEIKTSENRIYEIPFTSERKMMSVVVNIDETEDHFLYAKGAPEVILENCDLSAPQKKKILENAISLAEQGLRSLAVARRKLQKYEVKEAIENDKISEEGLEYLGLVSMQDPLRSEVKEAIAAAQKAGIRTIMITGDHMQTAKSIAIEAGICKTYDKVLTEDEVSALSKSQLTEEIKNGINVFARISPMGKLKIVEAIKSIPHMQLAVTGDGVNDAPALKAAHIGIAMGQTGTDITREVADVVLTDDNYATIVEAVREGRIIFANLVKFIRYLISCNLSEVIVVTAGVVFATPLPLLPIQILWINLITDGLPALALGVDPAEFDVMEKPPRDLSYGILHTKRWVYMMIEGSIMGVSVFGLYLLALYNFSYIQAQTMTFSALAFAQLIHAFSNRSTRKSLFKIGIFTNKYLVGAAILSILLQIAVVNTNFGNLIFKTASLGTMHWLLIICASFIPFVVVELKKQLRFRLLP